MRISIFSTHFVSGINCWHILSCMCMFLSSYIRTIIQQPWDPSSWNWSSSQVQLREVELEYHATSGIRFPWNWDPSSWNQFILVNFASIDCPQELSYNTTSLLAALLLSIDSRTFCPPDLPVCLCLLLTVLSILNLDAINVKINPDVGI